MIAFALALAQSAPLSVPSLGAIGRQALPASGCAAFLWRGGPAPELIAMATAAGALRISVDGRAVTLSRVDQRGEARLGLPASSDYAGEGMHVTLDLSINVEADLTDGARVPAGSLQVARDGGDSVLVPVAGLVGCGKGR